jgi:muconate cycloisomerase
MSSLTPSKNFRIKVTSVTLYQIKLPLRFKFVHARATHRRSESLIVALTLTSETGQSATGYGQILPRSYLTGETLESCWQDARDIFWPVFKPLTLQAAELPFLALQDAYALADEKRLLAVYAGFDVAVFDAWGRLTGQNLSQAFIKQNVSTSRGSPPLVAPLPLNFSAYLWPRFWRSLGFKYFKVKIKSAGDWRRLLTVSKSLKSLEPGAKLIVDANGSLSPNEAQYFLQKLENQNVKIAIFEEPLKEMSASTVHEIKSKYALKIMADESLCSCKDAEIMATNNTADIFNLRLAKIGGFSGLRRQLEIAAHASQKVWLGALVGESNLLAAAQHAALGLGEFEACEYNFAPFLLQGDPFNFGASKGIFFPWLHKKNASLLGAGIKKFLPGLGTELDHRRLQKITLRQTTWR